jgi:hypothetical protein
MSIVRQAGAKPMKSEAEEGCSFLKKRTKKLLPVSVAPHSHTGVGAAGT